MFNEDTKKKDKAPIEAAIDMATHFGDMPKKDNPHNVTKDMIGKPEAAAAADEVTEVIIDTADEDKIDMIVKLHKPLKFEGEIYTEIDMSGITDVTTNAARDIEKIYRKISKGSYDASPETTINWAIAATSVVTGLPVEFFNYLNIKDLVKMKNRVINFLYED